MNMNRPFDADLEQFRQSLHKIDDDRIEEVQKRRNRKAIAANVDGEFNSMRLLTAQAHNRVAIDAPYERQVSKHLAEQFGRQPQPGCDFFPVPDRQRAQRDLTVDGGSGGGYLVQPGLGDRFVFYLDTYAGFEALGIPRVMVPRPISIPGVSTNVQTFTLANQAAQITETTVAFNTSASTPHNLGVYFEMSRQLFEQASAVALDFLSRIAARAVVAEFWRQVFVGTGSNGQLQGIFGYSGVSTASGASANLTTFTNMIESVEAANALLTPTSAAFVIRANVAKLARTRDLGSGTGPLMTRNTLAGYNTIVSQGTSPNSAVFADWSQLLLVEFGQLEVGVDPYGVNGALHKAGLIGVRCWWTTDAILLNPKSFCVTGALN